MTAATSSSARWPTWPSAADLIRWLSTGASPSSPARCAAARRTCSARRLWRCCARVGAQNTWLPDTICCTSAAAHRPLAPDGHRLRTTSLIIEIPAALTSEGTALDADPWLRLRPRASRWCISVDGGAWPSIVVMEDDAGTRMLVSPVTKKATAWPLRPILAPRGPGAGAAPALRPDLVVSDTCNTCPHERFRMFAALRASFFRSSRRCPSSC